MISLRYQNPKTASEDQKVVKSPSLSAAPMNVGSPVSFQRLLSNAELCKPSTNRPQLQPSLENSPSFNVHKLALCLKKHLDGL